MPWLICVLGIWHKVCVLIERRIIILKMKLNSIDMCGNMHTCTCKESSCSPTLRATENWAGLPG